jgi:ferrous iron transport protein A
MLIDFINCGLADANPLGHTDRVNDMNLMSAQEGKEYIIQRIDTDDEELNAFLFSLGCYSGEPITVVSRKRRGCTVSIKDGRYNIDSQLAEAIIV